MRACQQCQESFTIASTGRPPRYCSATCRKKAWEARKMQEVVAVAVAKAVAAERRRANRGNETRQAPDIRGNETPPQATAPAPPAGPQQTELVMPQVFRNPAALPEGPSIRKRRRLLPPPPGADRPGPETG
ncbi:hypothetical protein GCM10022263_27950 [Nocardioides daeguensis]|uniref:Uncharacterized protein n=1 Tax=Nocardioides daeguensis TaxID=908359 RepID=A0ABP6VRV0_9ACTN